MQAVKILAERILGGAILCARGAEKELDKLFKPKWQRLIINLKRSDKNQLSVRIHLIVFLFFYIADKLAYEILGQKDRDKLMPILWTEIFKSASAFIKATPDGKSEYLYEVKDQYADFVRRFSKYEIWGEGRIKFQDTLLYVVTEYIIDNTTNHRKDIFTTSCFCEVLVKALSSLEIKKILESAK